MAEENKGAKAQSPKSKALAELHSSMKAVVFDQKGVMTTKDGVEVRRHGRGLLIQPARKKQG